MTSRWCAGHRRRPGTAIAEAHPVHRWIDALDANPGLVRSMSVQPPLLITARHRIEGADLHLRRHRQHRRDPVPWSSQDLRKARTRRSCSLCQASQLIAPEASLPATWKPMQPACRNLQQERRRRGEPGRGGVPADAGAPCGPAGLPAARARHEHDPGKEPRERKCRCGRQARLALVSRRSGGFSAPWNRKDKADPRCG